MHINWSVSFHGLTYTYMHMYIFVALYSCTSAPPNNLLPGSHLCIIMNRSITFHGLTYTYMHMYIFVALYSCTSAPQTISSLDPIYAYEQVYNLSWSHIHAHTCTFPGNCGSVLLYNTYKCPPPKQSPPCCARNTSLCCLYTFIDLIIYACTSLLLADTVCR